VVTRRWAPGDIYYACAIAQTLGRPCRYVVDEWDRNHGKGWGALAKELGIARFGRVPSPQARLRADLRPLGASDRYRCRPAQGFSQPRQGRRTALRKRAWARAMALAMDESPSKAPAAITVR
jgi:hypothetical protein